MPNEEKIKELEDKIKDLSNKLEELTNNFDNFSERINPDNLLNYSLDTDSKQIIINTINNSYLIGTLTWNPGNLVDGAGETSSSITVSGAELGDIVWISAPYDLQGITATGYVDAADSVKIRLQNETGGAIDLASGDWKVRVYKIK